MAATALGIDFYSENALVWQGADLHPPDFAIIGATAGLHSYYENHGGRPFAYDWMQCSKREIARSAYHYYIQSYNAVLQADRFLKEIDTGDGEEDFPLVIDIETTTVVPTPRADGIQTWLKRVEDRKGRRPMIYTSAEMWKQVIGDKSWAVDYEIWLAGYLKNPPVGWHEPNWAYRVDIPEPWKSAGKSWFFWQYASGGRDLDTFKSSVSDFNAYCKSYKSGTVIPVPPDNGGPVAEDKPMVVNTAKLNVRTQPTTSAPAMFQFSQGQKIVIDDASATPANGYTWVRVEAWVARELLAEIPPA